MKNPSVFIGIPSGDGWKADFGMSLAGLMATLNKPLRGGGFIEKIQLWNTKGSILSRSRHTLVQAALEAQCSHILMIDSDMVFPNWILHQLLAAEEMVVAANCVTKGLPAHPTARQRGLTPAGDLVDSTGKTGLEQVWRVGTGVMLIETSIFAKLPQPWFPIVWNEVNQDYTGEDWSFCQLCQDSGIPIYIDHGLSQHIGHIGSLTYSMEHTEENRNE